MFHLTFLGTSSGAPTKERNVSAIAVECVQEQKNKQTPWVLIDCGEGTQHQILRSHLSTKNLVAIMITHLHGDHCYGLAGLLASLGLHARTKPLTLIAPKALIKLLDMFSLVTELKFNYPIEFLAIEDLLEQGGQHLLVFCDQHKLEIDIHSLSHRCPSYGFALTQMIGVQKLDTKKLTELGIANQHWHTVFKQKDIDGQITIDGTSITPKELVIGTKQTLKIVIAGDNDTPELLADAVMGSALLVHEATYTDEIKQKILARPISEGGFDPKHSSAKQVAQFAQKIGLKHLILTHFSSRYRLINSRSSKGLLPVRSSSSHSSPKVLTMSSYVEEVMANYHGKFWLAEDFLSFEITDSTVRVLEK